MYRYQYNSLINSIEGPPPFFLIEISIKMYDNSKQLSHVCASNYITRIRTQDDAVTRTNELLVRAGHK